MHESQLSPASSLPSAPHGANLIFLSITFSSLNPKIEGITFI